MKKALGIGHRASGAENTLENRSSRVKAACKGVMLVTLAAVMSACAATGSGAAKRAAAVRGDKASAVSERIEKRLGPGKRTEIVVWPAPRNEIGGDAAGVQAAKSEAGENGGAK